MSVDNLIKGSEMDLCFSSSRELQPKYLVRDKYYLGMSTLFSCLQAISLYKLYKLVTKNNDPIISSNIFFRSLSPPS